MQQADVFTRRTFLARSLLAGGLAVGAGLLAACQPAAPAAPAAPTAAPAAAKPATGVTVAPASEAQTSSAAAKPAGKILVAGRLQDALILDPSNAGGLFNYTILALLYDKLLDVGQYGKIVGGLA